TLHIPVAFVPQQGAVLLESSCDPASIPRNTTTTCTVTATNNGSTEAIVDLTSTGNGKLRVVDAAGATVRGGVATLSDVVLPGKSAGIPAVAPGGLFGYLPLDDFAGT